MKYILRIQKVGSSKISKKIYKGDISKIVKALGGYGYHVITYCEWSQNDIYLLNTGK